MSEFRDPAYLKSQQYHNASNLDARIQLHRLYTVNEHLYHHWAFDLMLVNAPSNARVLEVGSGSAELWFKNKHRIPSGWQITLSDFSEGMLADGKARLDDAAANVEYKVIDVQDIPFEDDTFDLVIANYMLYHVPDVAQGIAELRRVLKPTGSLHAATLDENHMIEYKSVLESIAPDLNLFDRNTPYSFNLGNGADLLNNSFEEVLLLPYPSYLAVTEVEPMAAYVRSLINIEQFTEAQMAEFEHVVRAAIAEKGAFHITKESGTFIARGKR